MILSRYGISVTVVVMLFASQCGKRMSHENAATIDKRTANDTVALDQSSDSTTNNVQKVEVASTDPVTTASLPTDFKDGEVRASVDTRRGLLRVTLTAGQAKCMPKAADCTFMIKEMNLGEFGTLKQENGDTGFVQNEFVIMPAVLELPADQGGDLDVSPMFTSLMGSRGNSGIFSGSFVSASDPDGNP